MLSLRYSFFYTFFMSTVWFWFWRMNCFSDEILGVAEVCLYVLGENLRWKNTWGVTRGSFLWSDNRGGSYSEIFSDRENGTDVWRVGG